MRRLVQRAWKETLVTDYEIGASLPPVVASMRTINTTPIVWRPPETEICLLDLFGGMTVGLATVLHADIRVLVCGEGQYR